MKPFFTLAAVLSLLSGCGPKSETAVRLDLTYDDAWGLENLTVTASGQSQGAALAHEVRMVMPDGWAGQSISIVVWGNKGGQHFAGGNTTVTPVLKKEVPGAIDLSLIPCGAWCTAGATDCQGNDTVVCTANHQGCTDWASPTSCPSDKPYCSSGLCGATCIDECATGEKRCEGPGSLRICGQSGTSSCLSWLPALPCANGQSCSNGACSATCQDECKAGEVQCLGQGTVTCGDLNHDGCFEWGPIVPCTSGTTCSQGKCSSSCTDDCSSSMCSGNLFQMCGQFDLDSCKDLSPGVSCVPSDPCMVGSCTASGCQATAKECNTPPASTCKDGSTLTVYDASGTCSVGTCSYTAHDMACPNCPNCDTCAGVTCTTPPAATCLSPTMLRTYRSPGTCSDSSGCSYSYADMTCACTNGKCGSTQSWTTAAPLPDARSSLAAATGLDGRIYAFGGIEPSRSFVDEVDAYAPSTNSWAIVTPMPTARAYAGATTGLDGRIYVVGGFDGVSPLSRVEVYTPSTDHWDAVANMPTARYEVAVAAGSDGRIYALGGSDGSGAINTVEAYTPSTGTWATIAPMPTARYYLAAATSSDGRVFAIGGAGASGVLDVVEVYTPSTNSWATAASLPSARTSLAAATGLDGRLYAIGGRDNSGQDLRTVTAYAPSTGSWVSIAPMSIVRSFLAAATDSAGRIYAIGGYGANPQLNTVEIYTP